MQRITIGFGVALIALGLAGYLASGGESATALIPAAFGVPLAVAGALALEPRRRKVAMHVAVGLALLGFLGASPGLAGLARLAAGDAVARPVAVGAQAVMALLCAAFLALAIRSFVLARRAPAA